MDARSVTLDREFNLKRYSKLLSRECPRKIQSDEEYDALASRLEEIDLDPNASPEERAYADLLGILLEAYDDQSGPYNSGPEALAFLMEQNSLTKSDLARILGVSRGQATNIVNGHRAISKDVAKKLSEHFKLDIAVFLD